MKKIFGVSVLSAMLILGQPLMALADATGAETTSSDITSQDAITPRIINYADIKGIIAEQNIDVQIKENDSLIDNLSYADLKRTLKEYEDDLEDLDRERDQYRAEGNFALVIGLGAEKRALLDKIEKYERAIDDRPTDKASDDLRASRTIDTQTRLAEGMFIGYHQSKLRLSNISLDIDEIEDQLIVMQLQESLGMETQNNVNQLKTKLVTLQTLLESTKFQINSFEREFKNLLNDPENAFVIGSDLATKEDPIIEDEDAIDVVEDEGAVDGEEDEDAIVNGEDEAIVGEEDEDVVDTDLEIAYKNSYDIRLQELVNVSLQTALERAKKDNGMSSVEYKTVNNELTNANLMLTKKRDNVTLDYYAMIDDIAEKQSDLRLAEQSLEDEKVALFQAQVKKGLGVISRLALESATTKYQVEENAVKTKQIELFKAEDNYKWLLQGMPSLF